MAALRGFALLLVLQLVGELLTHAFGWLVPGPVLGLVLLFAALSWAPLRAPVEAAALVLLSHLSLLFVPVGAGIIMHTTLLAQYGLQLVFTLLLSTALGIAVTAWVLQTLLRRWPPQGDGPEPRDV
ncbi:holin-like protein [Sphaerotilus hippei]|uniref:Holin-like protein n=1 Tax=Sphaerotilus hippei TaxID=744406 RepID=A0A318GV64_9BURK|nr:CidA/LrgA family protein [Sphaerotilus hippei]PXW93298.1 holin-like protein [Sphaerotilus hippei]